MATITTINENDFPVDSRTVINDNFSNLNTDKAELASPTFTGTPSLPTGTTAVTQSASDNSTKLATTAYVDDAVGLVSFDGMPFVFRTGTSVSNNVFTAADSVTYYIGHSNATTPSQVSNGGSRIYIPKTGTITACYGTVEVSTTLSSGEDAIISIRLNDTTSTDVSTTIETNSSFNSFSNAALSIAVTAGDFIDVLFTTPAYSTNPTGVRITGTFLLE